MSINVMPFFVLKGKTLFSYFYLDIIMFAGNFTSAVLKRRVVVDQ